MRNWFLDLSSEGKVILAFSFLITVGTLLLLLPISTPPEKSLSITDAVFTSTSAVCVTGLIVVQTPWHFTWFGELVLLLLFQLGGIGIVLGSTLIFLEFTRSIGMNQRFSLQKTFSGFQYETIKKIYRKVFGLFFFVEFLGAAILTWQFLGEKSFSNALWHGIFHSVSAVCNAGFSVNPDSLVGYQNDPVVVLTVVVLIIFGGLGFPVLADLFHFVKKENGHSLHTRIMVLGTVVLILLGGLLFAVLEPGAGWMGWLFQSVTARTAGFNTVQIAEWGTPALLILMLLMFVGAGPSSTAGGIKITTFFSVVAHLFGRMKRREETHLLNRRLPEELETDLRSVTDPVEAIVQSSIDHRVTSIVFRPREKGFLSTLLDEGVESKMLRNSPVPVISLPMGDREE